MPALTPALLLLAAAPPPAPATAAELPAAPLIVDRNRADRLPVPPPRDAGPAPREAPARIEATPSAAPVRSIDFGGAEVPAAVARAAEGFLGKPASRATLEALAKAMSDAYAGSDVALYTVLVPAQRLDTGVVRVEIVEGHVEQVVFRNGMTRLLKAYATALTRERPLTRRTLERYVSLMRDIPGRRVDVQILRGRTPGGVIVQIDAHQKRKDATLSFDNRGTRLLGEGQIAGEAHGYGLLRDGGRTDLTGLASPDFNRLRYIAAAHTTPIGSDGLAATVSASYLHTNPRRSIVDGDARTFGLSLAEPVIRGYRRNLTLTLGIDGLNSDAAALGSLISSDHTRALRAAAGFSDARAKAALTAGITISHGLDILGARGLAGYSEPVFTKVNLRATYDRQLASRLYGRLRAAGQWSRDRLPPAERFAVGGADFGRAFDQALLSGDRGAAGAAELAWRPKLRGRLDGTELYAFADRATVTIEPRGPYRGASFTLASAGIGARLAYTPRAALNVEAARSIDRPYPGYRSGNWRINFGWRLSLARR